MAKYTREQRQRAVELYVKYECCAADVIRELGYPSREALRMWHRDWLDEQGGRACPRSVVNGMRATRRSRSVRPWTII